MLGKIIGIEENTVLVSVEIDLSKYQSLINLYVVMEEQDKKVVGEITNIKDNIAYVNLLGEYINDKFVFGVITSPAFSSTVKLISKERIGSIISVDNYNETEDLYFGESPIYQGVKIAANVDSFFSNHFAIFGSTGSGKSCSVSRIIQNLFEKKNMIPYKASIFMFDAYGEYHAAFENIGEKAKGINFKAYTTNLEFADSEIVKIPLWLLSVDDIALLLGAEKHSQLPIIEKALKLVTIFGQDEKVVIKHKNDIIARAILDIFASGRQPAQIRDQVFAVLTTYNTKELNLESLIVQPGYTRSLKQCMLIDATGKMREIELVTTFVESFLSDDLELTLPDGSFMYGLDDLVKAFDFALISEGVLKSDKIYDEFNTLKVRLHSLANGDYRAYFNCEEYMTRGQFIKSLILAPNGQKAQIINFNINYVDDRFAKTLTKIYSRMLFDYAKESDTRASFPINIVLEEAHRYVQNDNDVNLLGYNIFERITKEGRKYGVMLGLISQRPSELSETTLSQCSNFLIFKMLHPRDVEYIRDMVPNITTAIVKRLRVLQPGTCIAFGSAFKVPVIIRFQMPNPSPSSSSCKVSELWFIDPKKGK